MSAEARCIHPSRCRISSSITSRPSQIAPTHAFFDGVHTHDDLLEDFSRSAVDAHLRELGNFARRLAAINPDSLTPTQHVERPIVESHVKARIHELERVRSWERNPQMYAEVMALSLAGQVLFQCRRRRPNGRAASCRS